MADLDLMQTLAVALLPLLFAITVHEVAHGWVARQLGDPTAMMLGRLTLNPIKHIDPIGTLLVPGLLLAAGGVVFGWAKPVPVTWENLRNPRRDMALVALAGPLSNILMALIWALVVKLALSLGPDMAWWSMPLAWMGMFGISINIMLAVLNLLPILPLDGGRIVASLLPGPISWQYSRLEPYGMIILILLLVSGQLGKIITPVSGLFEGLIFSIFSL